MSSRATPTAPAPSDAAASDQQQLEATRGNSADAAPADEALLQGREPHHLRSLAEMGIGLGIGAIVYWTGMERNSPDWDNPRLVQRFDGSAWRLDNNSLAVNFILHPMVGAVAYSFARANHHGVAMSAGYSFLTSTLWEFAFEFKEMVSVNDVIVTPAAGIPLGEFMHKLGVYVGSAPQPGPAVQAVQWSLGPGVQLDRALDGADAPPLRDPDSLGLTEKIWHRFEFDTEVGFTHGPAPTEYLTHRVGFSGRLVSLPGYLKPGDDSRWFYNADVASLELGSELSRHGAGVELAADTLLAGHHLQHLRGTRAPTRGYALTTGASMAFRFLESEANDLARQSGVPTVLEPGVRLNRHRDAEQYSVVHFPGPGLDWQVFAPGIRLLTSVRAHPDFAGIGALAFSDWTNANPDEQGKAILLKQGYFYGWGGSCQAAGKLMMGPLHLGGELFYGRYYSQDGLERQPEKLTVDVPAEAQVLFYRGSLAMQPTRFPLAVGLSVMARRWSSTVGGQSRTVRLMSRGLYASVWF